MHAEPRSPLHSPLKPTQTTRTHISLHTTHTHTSHRRLRNERPPLLRLVPTSRRPWAECAAPLQHALELLRQVGRPLPLHSRECPRLEGRCSRPRREPPFQRVAQEEYHAVCRLVRGDWQHTDGLDSALGCIGPTAPTAGGAACGGGGEGVYPGVRVDLVVSLDGLCPHGKELGVGAAEELAEVAAQPLLSRLEVKDVGRLAVHLDDAALG
mmetsp:Transcript_43619/g.108884  ORF Transcript_43619/g.108884 Transcript_43619/m.108884 type:complete len:211 (-) Transcript_43619:2486-3118(-)